MPDKAEKHEKGGRVLETEPSAAVPPVTGEVAVPEIADLAASIPESLHVVVDIKGSLENDLTDDDLEVMEDDLVAPDSVYSAPVSAYAVAEGISGQQAPGEEHQPEEHQADERHLDEEGETPYEASYLAHVPSDGDHAADGEEIVEAEVEELPYHEAPHHEGSHLARPELTQSAAREEPPATQPIDTVSARELGLWTSSIPSTAPTVSVDPEPAEEPEDVEPDQSGPVETVTAESGAVPAVSGPVSVPVVSGPVSVPVESGPVSVPVESGPVSVPVESGPVSVPVESVAEEVPVESGPVGVAPRESNPDTRAEDDAPAGSALSRRPAPTPPRRGGGRGATVEPLLAASAPKSAAAPVSGDAAAHAREMTSQHSRRERLRGDLHSGTPEPAALLTAERLLDNGRRSRPAPESGWNRFLYRATFHGINLGDPRAVRERKATDARIRKAFEGGTRFVPVLTRKGGVGKTTVTVLLGMALAAIREDRIVAMDANPDRGTLAERVDKQTKSTVRDVVHKAADVDGFTDFSAFVSRDATRLDILASDTDPQLSEAFDEDDYNAVADLLSRFYSIVLTDCGTGIVHSVMRATLDRADSVVIVSGGSVDEARLASETLTWLEANGYGELVRNAVVALNTATQGSHLVRINEIESHFRSRVRDIVRIPYDVQLAAGSVVNYETLKPATKDAARKLAALVVEGLPVTRGA